MYIDKNNVKLSNLSLIICKVKINVLISFQFENENKTCVQRT